MGAWLTLAEERRLRKPANRSAHFAWGLGLGLLALAPHAPWSSAMAQLPLLAWVVAAGAGWVWEMGWWLAHGCDVRQRCSVVDLASWVAGAAAGVYLGVRWL
jgi:hypothetical protein